MLPTGHYSHREMPEQIPKLMPDFLQGEAGR